MNLPVGYRGRLLAVVLLLFVICASIAAVSVPAYVLYHRYDEAQSAAQERIDRYHRVSSQRADHQRALDLLKARESARFFLKNSVANLGGSELTDLVRPMLEANGSRLTSIQPPTVKDEAGFRVYSLSVGFNATPASLQKTLYAIETSIPYLFIENVTLRATVPRGYKPPPNQEPEVSATMEVQAYGPKDVVRNPRPPAAAGTGITTVTGGTK
ncbi:MAG: type II secretion system protein GspM [Casimicrobium sp.]